MSQTPTATPQVLTLGEPLVEFNQTSPSSQQYLQGFGGDVSTVAIAAARFGCSAAIITAIGNDPFGDLLRDLWQREGCRHVICNARRERPHRRVFCVAYRRRAPL
jgi:2-dehydro-3-deoxygluconokinase